MCIRDSRYAIPAARYEEHKIRAYGFHGTSHQYVTGVAAQHLGKPLADANLITVHLGNGCSITAAVSYTHLKLPTSDLV